MPLVRFAVRDEYRLGAPEVYKDGVQSEDPKAVLDGVAVAGLVGLLRQLGDLALFASEVFHGLQEQVASTTSRSRKLVTRLQRVEASLPSLEKAILSQTSHIHFAYTPGSEWHARIRSEQNHFICDDLPHFIMDSYEECREPPRLQLLDRFDAGGPGSCLKRYSDPTFFRGASARSEFANGEKSQRDRKARKIKRRRSWIQSGQFPHRAPILNGSGRMQFSSPTGQGQSLQSHTGSTFDMTFKSDLGDQSDSLGSKDGVDFIDCVFHPSTSIQPNETKTVELSSAVTEEIGNINKSMYLDEQTVIVDDDIPCGRVMESAVPHYSSVTWDEKLETAEPRDVNYGIQDIQDVPETNFDVHEQELAPVNAKDVNQVDDLSEHGSRSKSNPDGQYQKTTDGNFMEPTRMGCGIDEVQDLLETNFDLHEHDLEPGNLESFTQVVDLCDPGNTSESIAHDNLMNDPTNRKLDIDEVQHMPDANFNIAEQEMETINSKHVSRVDAIDVKVIEWDQQEPETINTEHVSQSNTFPDGANIVKAIGWNQWELEAIDAEHVRQVDTFSEGGNNVKAIEWNQNEFETLNAEHDSKLDTVSEGGMDVQVIEWNQLDDIESETDNFVDALNTIESESESELETQPRKQVQVSTSKDEPVQNTINDQTAEIMSHLEPEHECHSTSYDHKEGVFDDSGQPTAPASSANVESPEHAQPSNFVSEAATGQKQNDSTFLSDEQSLQTIQSSSGSNVSQGVDFCANTTETRQEVSVCDIAASDSQASLDERTLCTVHACQESADGCSSTYPQALWTNGTLLGLQPSKPTVFSMSSSVNSAPMTSANGITVGHCSPSSLMKKVGGPTETSASSVKDSKHGSNLDNDDQDIGSSKHLNHQISEKTHDTSLDKSNISDHSVYSGLSNGNSMAQESKVPVGADMKSVSTAMTSTSEDRSSLLSLLGHGLLKHHLRRSGSLGYYEKDQSISPLKTNEFENGCHAAVSHSPPETNLKGKLNSPVNSPPPSPPLEHMKVSFQPVDGFETSRLKLKYPEGIDHHESTVDTFPSFQLVPESSNLQQDMGSDSDDDDTFCQSYACMSDDSLGHFSDSGSEQWESGDSSESNDHARYDSLCKISSMECASRFPQHEETDHQSMHVGSRPVGSAHSLSVSSFGSPISDPKNSFAYEEINLSLNSEVECTSVQEPTPELPPLPPLQWRFSRPRSDAAEGKQDQGSGGQSFVPKLSESAIPHPATLDATVDSAKPLGTNQDSTKPDKLVEEQNINREKQTYHVEKGRREDNGGDFLHQIRTKSFNLKRTDTARSTSTPSPVTSNKITAILQKANAIRRAVGSDDGEDDSWSDT